MEEINIQLAQSSLNLAIYSMRFSIDEIRTKHPERIDLINSMEKHIKGLAESLVVFREMEKENRMLRRMNMNYHIENMELRYENERLKKTNENLLDGI
jgi:hypothetical protein